MSYQKQYPYFKGQFVWIAYGNLGDAKQLAEVIEDCGKKYAFGNAKWDYLRVRKWLKNSKRWTGVVRVSRESVLGIANTKGPYA